MFDFIENEELREKAVAEFEAQTTGLKTKNDELLNEKKTIQERLKAFDSIDDPAAAMEALKFIRENEQARLLQEGKFEEVIEKRVSKIKSDAMTQIEDLTTRLDISSKEAVTYKTKFNSKIIEDELRNAALAAGILSEALTDVLMRGRMEFNLADDGVSIEARDAKGALRKNQDGIVLTPQVWMEGLKSSAPHFWPKSDSADFTGKAVTTSELMQRMKELLDKGDVSGYRKLRDSQKK